MLGPLVTDIFPGYDHITSCIGATAAAYHGAAMLCYVTPKEHLGLPKRDDVKQGCVAYKIAAHAADVALGIPARATATTSSPRRAPRSTGSSTSSSPSTRTLARAYHDEDLDVDTDFCAMCGHDWCSVRISKEIARVRVGQGRGLRVGAADDVGGAHPRAARDPREARRALARRRSTGLASKTRRAMGGARGARAACHSELTSDDEAHELQGRLDPVTLAPLSE